MYHYMCFVSLQPTFGFLSKIGWIGVDLFFALSGYLIGNQIFSALANSRGFNLNTFYYRRLLRTLPNYLFVLGIYFLIPGFKEFPTLPPLWKFLTFTQNFNLHSGTAFSNAWSLCIEEQFYLVLPLLALFISSNKSVRSAWTFIFGIMTSGILLRSFLWHYYMQHANGHFENLYQTNIYYSSFCRLDELTLGVGLALLRNFHPDQWTKLIAKGNSILLFGIIGSLVTCYLFLKYDYSLLMTAIGYPLLAMSFVALTLAALSPNSYLYKARIPGTASIAVWSYAIYLTQKPISVLTYNVLAKLGLSASNFFTLIIIILVCCMCGWLLYTFIETPFLKLRDIVSNKNTVSTIKNKQLISS